MAPLHVHVAMLTVQRDMLLSLIFPVTPPISVAVKSQYKHAMCNVKSHYYNGDCD